MRLWQPPKYIGFQAPVPPPPDYSTPDAVNARIREFCGRPWYAGDKGLGKLYRELRAAVDDWYAREACDEVKPTRRAHVALPCPVADTHHSKWDVVRDEAGAWTLVPRKGLR